MRFSKFFRIGKTEHRGAILVIVAVAMPLMLLFLGLIMDFGLLYTMRARMQDIADAAALAGASVRSSEKQDDLLKLNEENLNPVGKAVMDSVKGNDSSFNDVDKDADKLGIVKYTVPKYDGTEAISNELDASIASWMTEPNLGGKNVLIEYSISGPILQNNETSGGDDAVTTKRKTYSDPDRVRVRLSKKMELSILGAFFSEKLAGGTVLTVKSAAGLPVNTNETIEANADRAYATFNVKTLTSTNDNAFTGIQVPLGYVVNIYGNTLTDMRKFLALTDRGNEVNFFYSSGFSINSGEIEKDSYSDFKAADLSFTEKEIALIRKRVGNDTFNPKTMASASIYDCRFDTNLSSVFTKALQKFTSSGIFVIKDSQIQGIVAESREHSSEIWQLNDGKTKYLGKVYKIAGLADLLSRADKDEEYKSDEEYKFYEDGIETVREQNNKENLKDKVASIDPTSGFQNPPTDSSDPNYNKRYVQITAGSGSYQYSSNIKSGDKDIDLYIENATGGDIDLDNAAFGGATRINNLYIKSSNDVNLKTSNIVFNNIYVFDNIYADQAKLSLSGIENVYKGQIFAGTIDLQETNSHFLKNFALNSVDELNFKGNSNLTMGRSSAVIGEGAGLTLLE